jgi:hypothetical protein
MLAFSSLLPFFCSFSNLSNSLISPAIFRSAHGANVLLLLIAGPYLENRNGLGASTNASRPKRVHAQLTPSRWNICTVKSGKPAATAERMAVLAAKAEAEYMRYVSTRYDYRKQIVSLCVQKRKGEKRHLRGMT